MLAIQFKQLVPQDVVKPLQSYLKSNYSFEDMEKYQLAVESLQQLRTDAGSVRTPSSISKHVLLRYFGQLQLTETRFPISETQLKLPFTWYDSFAPRKKITQYSVKFEQAAIMFNYGALESQMGFQEDRSSEEGLKAACRHFMLAAGIFEYLEKDLSHQILGPRTPDLTPDGLSLLHALMLAQAQACFYEKSVKDKMVEAIKAKLANQAAEFYVSVLQYARSPTLKSVLDKSWAVHLEFQIRCLRAASQYWQAKTCKQVAVSKGSGYGEEIARLQVSEAECQAAIDLAVLHKLPSSLPASVQQLKSLVVTSLYSATKDNNSIYMEMIPKFNDLAPIGKVAMVKALPVAFHEIEMERGPDLFDGLVPNGVQQKAAELAEKLRDFCEKTTADAQEHTKRAREKLASLGLPASIEAHGNDAGLPDSTWNKIEACQKKGAVGALETSLMRNVRLAQDAGDKLADIEQILSQEASEDTQCRQAYGVHWNREASSKLNKVFYDDVVRYQRLLQEAKQSDNLVQTRLAHQDIQQISQLNRFQLAELLPRRQAPANMVDTSVLSQLLVNLGTLIQERQSVQQLIRTECSKVDSVALLVKSQDTPVETLLEMEKAKLAGNVQKLLDSYVEESHLMEDIVEYDRDFKAGRRSDEVTIQREEVLMRLDRAVDLYDELTGNLLEGGQFYTDLNYRIDQLQQTVNDHCSARSLEKRELELNLGRQSHQNEQMARDAALAQQFAHQLNVNPSSSSRLATNEYTVANDSLAFPDEMSPGGPPTWTRQGPNQAALASTSHAYYPGAMASTTAAAAAAATTEMEPGVVVGEKSGFGSKLSSFFGVGGSKSSTKQVPTTSTPFLSSEVTSEAIPAHLASHRNGASNSYNSSHSSHSSRGDARDHGESSHSPPPPYPSYPISRVSHGSSSLDHPYPHPSHRTTTTTTTALHGPAHGLPAPAAAAFHPNISSYYHHPEEVDQNMGSSAAFAGSAMYSTPSSYYPHQQHQQQQQQQQQVQQQQYYPHDPSLSSSSSAAAAAFGASGGVHRGGGDPGGFAIRSSPVPVYDDRVYHEEPDPTSTRTLPFLATNVSSLPSTYPGYSDYHPSTGQGGGGGGQPYPPAY